MLRDSNLYDELGVRKDAPASQIKRAYRKRAKSEHPDVGGSKEGFARLQHAYMVLSSEPRRKRYDETGREDEPPRDDTRALDILAQLFTSIVDQVDDLDQLDVVRTMRETLHAKRGEMKGALAKLSRNIKAARTAEKRIMPKGNDRRLTNIVAGVAARLERKRSELEDDIRPLDLAIKIVESNTFMTAQQSTVAGVTFFTVGGFAASSSATTG